MVQDSGVMTRVTTPEGAHIKVRKDELERYLAAHPGTTEDAAAADQAPAEAEKPAEAPAENEDKPAEGDDDKGTARGRGR